jgi:hypothetical protein
MFPYTKHIVPSLLLLFAMVFLLACRSKKEVIIYPDLEVLDIRSTAEPYYTLEEGKLVSIDVPAIMEDCIPVFINVNVHWFLEDDCGDVYNIKELEGMRREEAFEYAHRLIEEANAMWINMADNEYYQASQAPEPSKPQCIPIQYVLRDVLVHCDTKAQNTRVGFTKFYPYVKDGDKFMNIFISNVNGASGFAGGRGHMLVMENISPALLNHEMGHNFSLMHAYINERSNAQTKNGCMDVFLPASIEWDGDGDGKMDNKKPKGNCWNTMAGGDENKNGVGDWCEGIYKDNPHPCCSWAYQNNNLMVSSALANSPNYAAVTPCQIETMMHTINEKKLKYVEQVGGCPPPSAVLGQFPKQERNSEESMHCFHMEASFNVDNYHYKIWDEATLVFESNAMIGQPEVWCLQEAEETSWMQKLVDGRTYTLELSVSNSCRQESQTSIQFLW